jgi:hypothetical protein
MAGDDEGGSRRPARRAASKNVNFHNSTSSNHAAPSAMHYVGYVEEDETPGRVARTPGWCQIGYMDHSGCHMDRTGRHQLVWFSTRTTRVGTPGCLTVIDSV